MFHTNQGTEELKNVYNIALLVKDLQKKMQLYGMGDVFIVLSFDENRLPTTDPPISLFSY
eukprot:11217040-Ditylum_brightwellii.AAC.1